MKHLTQQDLYLLINLVNSADEQIGSTSDLTEVVRRQDREFKSLPAETLDEAAKITAPINDVRRKLKVIRQRLIAELQS